MNAFVQLFSWLQFLIALVGCTPTGTSYSSRIATDDHTKLYSTAIAKDGVARFECRESGSGTCYYTLYAPGCEDASTCKQPAFNRFALKEGERREIAGLENFHPCVTTDAKPVGPDCQGVQ